MGGAGVGQNARVIIVRLTSWIALVTSMPRGQASVQLKIVRHRGDQGDPGGQAHDDHPRVLSPPPGAYPSAATMERSARALLHNGPAVS